MTKVVYVVYVEDVDGNWYIDAIYTDQRKAEQRRDELESKLSPDVYCVGIKAEYLIP